MNVYKFYASHTDIPLARHVILPREDGTRDELLRTCAWEAGTF